MVNSLPVLDNSTVCFDLRSGFTHRSLGYLRPGYPIEEERNHMENMKALVAYGPEDYRLEDRPVPIPGPGEILIKVSISGICAGDVKSFHGGIRIWGTSEADRYIEAPVIGGHEFVGSVAALGAGVTAFTIGERVVTEQILPCEECVYCRKGMHWMCQRSAVFGFKQVCHGGFAEYAILPANARIHRVPDSLSDEQAALIEPIACGMHAVNQAQIRRSDVVVIAGMGGIGLSMINIAAAALPRAVIGVDLRDDRLALGHSFGADAVVNPLKENLDEVINSFTDGLGCDVYIEASGSAASVTQGLNCLRNHGRFVQMGVFSDPVTADWNIIGDGKELHIFGSHLSGNTYPAVIKGISQGRILTDDLITHRFSLTDWKRAFETAESGPGARKVVLVPGKE